jgi:hypothetical protein
VSLALNAGDSSAVVATLEQQGGSDESALGTSDALLLATAHVARGESEEALALLDDRQGGWSALAGSLAHRRLAVELAARGAAPLDLDAVDAAAFPSLVTALAETARLLTPETAPPVFFATLAAAAERTLALADASLLRNVSARSVAVSAGRLREAHWYKEAATCWTLAHAVYASRSGSDKEAAKALHRAQQCLAAARRERAFWRRARRVFRRGIAVTVGVLRR